METENLNMPQPDMILLHQDADGSFVAEPAENHPPTHPNDEDHNTRRRELSLIELRANFRDALQTVQNNVRDYNEKTMSALRRAVQLAIVHNNENRLDEIAD